MGPVHGSVRFLLLVLLGDLVFMMIGGWECGWVEQIRVA